jgi:hypothetical protein
MLVCTLSISLSMDCNSECNDLILSSNKVFNSWIESISLPMFSIFSLNELTSVLIPLTLNKVNAKKIIQIIIKIFVYVVLFMIINNVLNYFPLKLQMQQFDFL